MMTRFFEERMYPLLGVLAKNPVRISSYLVVLIALNSCEKDPFDFTTPPTHHFDVMAQKLEEKIAPFTVGMGYAIIKNGELKANGSAGNRQVSVASQPLPYLSDTRQTTFSITKTLTAIATIAYLNQNGLSLNSPIKGRFPHTWDVSNVSGFITFKDLLTHTSGFTGTLDSYDDMKAYIEGGSLGSRGPFNYANVNYTLLRILLPMANEDIRFTTTASAMTDYNIDLYLSYEFVGIMRNEVTGKAGLSGDAGPKVWDMADPSASTMLYNFQNQNQGGAFILSSWPELSDFILLCGAGGWYLNTVEYATVIDKLFRKQLNASVGVDQMKAELLGMYTTETGTPGVKRIYRHSGSSGSNRGGRSQWVYLEEYGITVVVFVNSNNSGEPFNDNLLGAILEAVEESYYN